MTILERRRESVHSNLLWVSKELKKRGCRVYTPKGTDYFTLIHIRRGDKAVNVGFAYRWYMSSPLDDMVLCVGRTNESKFPFSVSKIFENLEEVEVEQPVTYEEI